MPTIDGEKSKSKFGALQTKLLKLHPGELRDSEATMILNNIRSDPEFEKAWRNATPSKKKKKNRYNPAEGYGPLSK
jgi:hypothetical protein